MQARNNNRDRASTVGDVPRGEVQPQHSQPPLHGRPDPIHLPSPTHRAAGGAVTRPDSLRTRSISETAAVPTSLQTIPSSSALDAASLALPPLHPKTQAATSSPLDGLLTTTGGVGGSNRHLQTYSDDVTAAEESSIDWQAGAQAKHGMAFNDDDSSMGSIVFNYRPGKDTPPAEYDLPKSILKIYRDRPTPTSTNSAASDGSLFSFTLCSSQDIEDRDGPDDQPCLPYHERRKLFQSNSSPRTSIVTTGSTPAAPTVEKRAESISPLDSPHESRGDDSEGKRESSAPRGGWFNQFTSLVTGGRGDANRYGSIEDEKRRFKDRGQDFLKKTERERALIKKQQKEDTLARVIDPFPAQVGHNRDRTFSRMSNVSALDSIPSCSCSEEDSEDDDVEDGSSKDDIKTKQRIMREEYEWRIHQLKRENERLRENMKLGIVIVFLSVFVVAMGLGFVVCIKMLLQT